MSGRQWIISTRLYPHRGRICDQTGTAAVAVQSPVRTLAVDRFLSRDGRNNADIATWPRGRPPWSRATIVAHQQGNPHPGQNPPEDGAGQWTSQCVTLQRDNGQPTPTTIAKNLSALPHRTAQPRQLAGFSTQLLPGVATAQMSPDAQDVVRPSSMRTEQLSGCHRAKFQSAGRELVRRPPLTCTCTMCDKELFAFNLLNRTQVLQWC